MSDAINMLARRVKELEAQVASMQAEAPQATKDAEDAARYRWARENASLLFDSTQAWPLENGKTIYSAQPAKSEWDAAIDAARKSQGEQERTPEQLARDLQTNQEIDAMVEKMKQPSDEQDAYRLMFLAPAKGSRFIEQESGMYRVYADVAMEADPRHKWQAMTPIWYATPQEAIDAAVLALHAEPVEKMKGEGA